MRIGVVGLGMVGDALRYGFTRIGHEVVPFDIKMPETKFEDVLTADLVFVCVPTPSSSDGSCDTSIVESVVRQLGERRYAGLVVIKSTVTPGTTDSLSPHVERLAFCPEFLREKARYSDFVDNHELLVMGAYSLCDAVLIGEAHGSLPKAHATMKPLEAELAKYFCNAFNATRIMFASQFFEVCEQLGADYAVIKAAVTRRPHVGNHYLDCNRNFRRFGGACLPKDLSALAALVRDQGIDAPLFDFVLRENERLPRA